jgi:hypothetical protein
LEARTVQANHHTLRATWATAFGRLVLAAIAVAAQAGCSSPLTTVALREFLRESTMTLAIDSDAEETSKPDADSKGSAPKSGDETADARLTGAAGDESASEDASEDVSVEERVGRSLERLARTSGFDQVARDVLVETLEKAAPEDWPIIIDSFALSLETSSPRPSPNPAAASSDVEPSRHTVAKPSGGLTIPVTATVNVEADREQPPAAQPDEEAEQPPEKVEEPQPSEPVPQEDPAIVVAMLKERLAEARRNAPLTVRRACFASKVRGWGNLDAVEEPHFVPGQDVLVYVELDNLDGVEGQRGFSTRVAATLRLVDAAGDVVEEWSFPAVEDRADSPRTDYFVRYVVRIPADATTGDHRLEAAITDAVSSKIVATSLPLEVVSAAAAPAR